MSNEEADVLFRRYLKEVRGIDLKEDGGMVFIIKFKNNCFIYWLGFNCISPDNDFLCRKY